MFRLCWREPYLFFTFRSHQRCKMSVQKEKLQSRERNVYARQTSFSAIFLVNKITSSPGSFYFLALMSKREEAQGMRLHKV